MRNLFLLGLLLLALFVGMVGCEREVIDQGHGDDDSFANDENCFGCHGDEGYLLQAKGEWLNSVHASGTNIDYTNRGGSDCTQCHNHQGFIEFVATGEVSAPYDNVSSIHCFTCHAPHERGDLSLRTEAAFTLANGVTFDYNEGNLCANCHHSRIDVGDLTDPFTIPSPYWGPHHGPQGDLLAGTNGYEFPGYTYGNTSHAGAIDKSCVTCHMGDPQQHSGFGVGGHSFNIEDEEGNSIVGVCAECHDGATGYGASINFTADSDYDHDGEVEGYMDEIHGLGDSLAVLLIADGIMDNTNHGVKDYVADIGTAGAFYNFLMYEEDRSAGIHNFRYVQGLLQSSIEFMNAKKAQGIGPQVAVSH